MTERSLPTLRMGHREACRVLAAAARGVRVQGFILRGAEKAEPGCPTCGRTLTVEDGAEALEAGRCYVCHHCPGPDAP